MSNTIARRWGDHDRYFGPFTWSYSDSYPHWAVVLRSRGEEGGDGGRCSLRLSLWKATIIVTLPGIVQPWREKKRAHWDAETVARIGRDWYWNVYPRQFGLSVSDGHLSVYYGRETHDSSTEQRWGCFLPWRQWRHVRHSLYDLAGDHFWTDPKDGGWDAYRDAKERCPRAVFAFEDFDGQRLTATTRIEEREWHFGEGWFKWLSWFRRPKISRSLDLEFSDEVGPEKGSWKGGTIGHSIEMLPGELHEGAFRRYCDQEHNARGRRYRIKFLAAAPKATA
jgi:hypothetical protein